MVVTSPVFFFFAGQGKAGTGRAAWILAGMFFIDIKMRWRFRCRAWFWITIACLLALHVPFILYVLWTGRWIPAVAILPIGVLDLGVILGSITFAEKLASDSSDPGKAPDF